MWLSRVTLDNLESWREEEELGHKEGCSELPASHQQITYRCITMLVSDTNGLSYSNDGNWEAASLNRFPSINITVMGNTHPSILHCQKKGVLLLLFSSRTTFLS